MSKSDKNFVVINYCRFYDNDYVFVRCIKKHFFRTCNSLNYVLLPFNYFGTIRFIDNEWYLCTTNKYDKIVDLIICDCTRDIKNEK